MSNNDLLGIALSAAVPLRIAELQELRLEVRWRRIREWTSEAVDVICAKGELLMYKQKPRGGTASAFNHLARGLAALAFAEGGVTFAGWHWCAEPHLRCPTRNPIITVMPRADVL